MIRGADGANSGVGGVDGLLAGPADPEAEAALLLHPGESYYALPRIASPAGDALGGADLLGPARGCHNFLTPRSARTS